MCGRAAMNGAEFKELLAADYEIQINKTSRNSVLFQININNTRGDVAQVVKVLADISRKLDAHLRTCSPAERQDFDARVRDLVDDVPDLPDFSRFADAFRDDPGSATRHGHMRKPSTSPMTKRTSSTCVSTIRSWTGGWPRARN